MNKIILASASPRRRELLTKAGIEFEVHSENVDETVPEGTEPSAAAGMTAEKKALACAKKFPDDIIIGADTIVVSDGKIMGKPKDDADAERMLTGLSGKEHEVITGVCIVHKNTPETFHCISRVKFFELDEAEIKEYIKTGEPADKAGAYGIQGLGCKLVESINGDYFNIVGLPVAQVIRRLKKYKIEQDLLNCGGAL